MLNATATRNTRITLTHDDIEARIIAARLERDAALAEIFCAGYARLRAFAAETTRRISAALHSNGHRHA